MPTFPHMVTSGLILSALVLLITGAVLYRFLARRSRRHLLHRRFRRAAKGESKARQYLERNGFRILAEQASLDCVMRVDGRNCEYSLMADFLVSRSGERAIVEAKTGTRAVDPVSRNTRRQLLEYAAMYDVDAVYLFDAEKGRLHRVAFAHQAESGGPLRMILTWVFGCVCGIAASWLVLMATG